MLNAGIISKKEKLFDFQISSLYSGRYGDSYDFTDKSTLYKDAGATVPASIDEIVSIGYPESGDGRPLGVIAGGEPILREASDKKTYLENKLNKIMFAAVSRNEPMTLWATFDVFPGLLNLFYHSVHNTNSRYLGIQCNGNEIWAASRFGSDISIAKVTVPNGRHGVIAEFTNTTATIYANGLSDQVAVTNGISTTIVSVGGIYQPSFVTGPANFYKAGWIKGILTTTEKDNLARRIS